MRQAGRSLPEYRKVREGTTMLEACTRPDLVTEITLQPVRRYGVDAAIFFSDIVIPLKLAGVDVDIVAGVGPVMGAPVRSLADVRALPELDPAALAPITSAVGITVDELGSTPLIGFAGAPFTLASYLVEGGPSKDKARTRAMMREDPEAWTALMAWIAEVTGDFEHAVREATHVLKVRGRVLPSTLDDVVLHAQLEDGGQVTGVHVLRGLSDTRGPMVIAVVGYWVVGLGSALLLGFPLGLGAAGIWLGLVIGLAFAAVALIWRFAGRVKRGELPAIAR